MSRKEKPPCEVYGPWVRDRLNDRHALAPLTGQDHEAMNAFAHLVLLYGRSDGNGRTQAIHAMAACLRAMQPKCTPIAKAMIPCMLDWGHEEEIWTKIKRLDPDVRLVAHDADGET